MHIEPLAIGVCSWSLQVTSVPELKRLMDGLGVDVVQIACGDPHHAAWNEGDAMPKAACAARFRMSGTMLGFPGEDYTTPQTIQKTGGFGDPTTRPERLDRFRWALDRTLALGLSDIMLHAGFLPEPGTPDRKPFLETLAKVSQLAAEKKVTVAFVPGGVMWIAACDLHHVDAEAVHEPFQLRHAGDLERPTANANGERFDVHGMAPQSSFSARKRLRALNEE